MTQVHRSSLSVVSRPCLPRRACLLAPRLLACSDASHAAQPETFFFVVQTFVQACPSSAVTYDSPHSATEERKVRR